MTYEIMNTDAPHQKWFKREQGRFLKEARDKAALSPGEVSKWVGFDIDAIESGKTSLSMSNLARLTELYRVPQHDFMMWQFNVGKKVRQMLAEL